MTTARTDARAGFPSTERGTLPHFKRERVGVLSAPAPTPER